MNLISSSGKPLRGIVSLPGDKSLSHRAALFAALAYGESHIDHFLCSGVTRAMLEALSALGVNWKLDGTTLLVQGRGLEGLRTSDAALNCGGSATTLRLLTGALSAAGISAVLDGSPSLRRRPMQRIVEPLQSMGVKIEAASGCAPLTLSPRSTALLPLDYTLPVASAQVKTCLLLAALAANGTTTLREPGPSRDHTERMLRSMGVDIRSERLMIEGQVMFQTRITPPSSLFLKPLFISLPSDISAAAFLIIAALITPGSDITIRQVGLNSGRTGLLDVLLAMGADIHISAPSNINGEPAGDLRVRYSRLNATHVSGDTVVRMIDEFPVFAVAAAYASGVTVVSDAAELRHKESDRISALCQELQGLGIRISETPDGFTIEGGLPVSGGVGQPHSDHRLAMSLAVAGLAAQNPVTVEGAEIMDESFPEFVSTLQMLGADLAYCENEWIKNQLSSVSA